MNQVAAIVELFERHPSPEIGKDDFDDSLWGAVCDLVPNNEALKTLPVAVRTYYVTRYVEWEVANGGFGQLIYNVWSTSDGTIEGVTEFFNHVVEGYTTLGRQQAANLMRKALEITGAECARISKIHGAESIQAVFDYFNEEVFDGLDAQFQADEGVEFWSDAQRLAYVVAKKDEFITAAAARRMDV